MAAMATKGAAAQPGRWEPRRKAGPQARCGAGPRATLLTPNGAAIYPTLAKEKSNTSNTDRKPRAPFS